MRAQIARLGTDTAIYGLSTIVGRFLTFLLTPVYANLLIPADLGVVATMYAYIAFLNVVYGYGMESAFFRYAAERGSWTPREVFTVPFLSVSGTALLLSLLLAAGAGPVSRLAGAPAELIPLAAAVLALDAIAVIPFAALRAERKAKQFATVRLAGIGVNVGLNLLFLLVWNEGVRGIFLSNVISSGLVVLMLLPVIVRRFGGEWRRDLYGALLRFGLPLVPAGIATMMIQVIDRPILEALTDRASVGIYQANYRLGIFMMLVVSTFDFAWRPFSLAHGAEPGAPRMFARILTYFLLLGTGMFLLLSLFLEDLVKLPLLAGRSILPEPYWSGLPVIPVVLLAYLCLGFSNNIVAGVYIAKRTGMLPPVTFFGALVNVVANLVLIPVWGIMGAAVATLLSYAGMAALLAALVRRVYPVEYETARILKVIGAGALMYGASFLVRELPGALFWKGALVAGFAALMGLFRFFNAGELQVLGGLFRSRSAPAPESEGSQKA